MTVNAVDFASLLCSRLCHDLLSPVGAMNNGLELLADENDPEMQARCLELLGESANQYRPPSFRHPRANQTAKHLHPHQKPQPQWCEWRLADIGLDAYGLDLCVSDARD